MSGNIVVNGTITCKPEELDVVAAGLRDHVRLTNAEEGCISFTIDASADNPCLFIVSERFVDQAAFDVHGARTRAAEWWGLSQNCIRDFNIVEE
ncbi:MAG: putative quinol monooxygenase [Paracoccaceae bacterium]